MKLFILRIFSKGHPGKAGITQKSQKDVKLDTSMLQHLCHPNAKNLMKPSIGPQISLRIRKLIMDKNPTNVKTIVSFLLVTHDLFCIRESTLKRNHTDVKSVVNLLLLPHNLLYIRESTLKKNRTNVKRVVNLLLLPHNLFCIRESTLEKNHTNVNIVTLINIRQPH
jgi:hypothetical protein